MVNSALVKSVLCAVCHFHSMATLTCVSAETAVHHPWAGAVSSLQEFWRHALHRWDAVWKSPPGRKPLTNKTDFVARSLKKGKKQDVWFVVDPETGEKQTSLTTSASESICPNTPLLYIGRTGKSLELSRTRILLRCAASHFGLAPRRVHGHHVWHQDTGAALERHVQRLLCAAIWREARLQ